jgi:hypothetical protein
MASHHQQQIAAEYTHTANLPHIPVPEFIDPVFAKTSLKHSFSIIENERFGLRLTGSINSGTDDF